MSEKLFGALRWASVTPSDTARLEPIPVALFVGDAGTVRLEGDDGVTADFVCPAGMTLTAQPRKVMATGTDATSIVAMYNS